MMGEDYDEEGNPHTLALAWNAVVLHAHFLRQLGEDDRAKLDIDLIKQQTGDRIWRSTLTKQCGEASNNETDSAKADS